jgi:nucleoside-diphosphate-sugar epimerase
MDVIYMIEDITGDQILPVFEPPRPGDVKHSQASISKARRLLGYSPRIGFKEGLYETVEWFRKCRVLALGKPHVVRNENVVILRSSISS